MTRTTHGSPAHQKSGTPLAWRGGGVRLINGRQCPSVADVPEHPATQLTQRCISLTHPRCSSVRMGKICGVMETGRHFGQRGELQTICSIRHLRKSVRGGKDRQFGADSGWLPGHLEAGVDSGWSERVSGRAWLRAPRP